MSTAALPSSVVDLDCSPPFRAAKELLSRAEAAISLIDRAQPQNAALERAALIADFGRGNAREPEFHYRAPPNLGELRRALELCARVLESEGPLGQAYADRARELWIEAAAAEAIGSARLPELAALRFRLPSSLDVSAAEDWVRAWLSSDPVDESTPLHRSDDAADPDSLLCALERATRDLPLRIEVRSNQVAAASVGEGFIAIRAGLLHGEQTVRRIVLHELSGHAEPRLRAKNAEIGLFRVGSACSSEHEEGRALLLERRAGLLGTGRRRELARRHRAAARVREGLPFVQVVEALLAVGQTVNDAVEAACRAYRGGGLAREIVYLPALSCVARAFERQAELERYLERGRLGIAAAEACAVGFRHYESSTTTGM